MKRKVFNLILCLIFFLTIIPTTVYADIGPKPSVVIDFNGLENEKYYVTLLSEMSSTGPFSALDEYPGNQSHKKGDKDYEIWEKFVSYRDENGYHFLQYFNNCTETSQFTWGYYPPSRFKILIYFPEYDKFAVSEKVYERYAFDSYFAVDAKGLELESAAPVENIKAVKNYDYTWELISLFARIIATIAIEVLIALLFGFRAKKQLLTIVAVNVFTQSILNILLNVTNYNHGSMMFIFNYIWMELVVLVIEVVVYSAILQKDNIKKKWLVPLYALTANAVSFGIGLYISYLVPGIF